MARLARLAVAGQAHLLVQRGVGGQPFALDDEDRRAWRAALADAARANGVAVHAWALADAAGWLLVTPPEGPALGRTMQALGRRYVGGFNRRHGRHGTLFEGRFRGAVVEPGAWRLDALLFVVAQAAGGAPDDGAPDPCRSSVPHHLGRQRDPLVTDLPEFWSLGNTPFDREQVFAARLVSGLPPARAERLAASALHGWAVGSPSFVAALAAQTTRPVAPRRRGRPPRGTGTAGVGKPGLEL